MIAGECYSTKDAIKYPHSHRTNKLRSICTMTGQWRQSTRQQSALITIRRNPSRKIEKMLSKWLTTNGKNTNIEDQEFRDLTVNLHKIISEHY